MAIILADTLRKREFPEGLDAGDREMLSRAARVTLAESVKGEGLPKGTRLLKAYATSNKGPRRIVWLLEVKGGDLFFLFCRDKKDAVGENISPKNPAFRATLKKHLRHLASDIAAGAWSELPDA